MEELLREALSTERVLSLLLLVAVIGLGRWFMHQGWPDIVALMRERNEVRRQECEGQIQADIRRAELAAESDRLLADRLENLTAAFRDWVAEVRASIAIQQTHTNFLVHILERQGGQVTDAFTDEARPDFGGGG